jgi:phospholipase/carboxylesterase
VAGRIVRGGRAGRADAAAADLNAYLDGILAAEGLTPDRLALVGFSQGSMMSCMSRRAGMWRWPAWSAFSGRLLAPELLGAEARVKPPVLLLHGDADPVVPFEDMGRPAMRWYRPGSKPMPM